MTNQKLLKLGLDYHGVISDLPNLFSNLAKKAIEENVEIHILTGWPGAQLKEKLKELDIPFTKIFSVQDYYKEKGMYKVLPSGELKIDDHLWQVSKSIYCKKYQIDFHIDNGMDFLKHFTTPYCFYSEGHHSCVSNDDKVIDLSSEPSIVLNRIRDLLANQS